MVEAGIWFNLTNFSKLIFNVCLHPFASASEEMWYDLVLLSKVHFEVHTEENGKLSGDSC